MAEIEHRSKVRFTFETEATRHAFMMKALSAGDIPYKLDNGVSVLMPADEARRFRQLADTFGGTVEQPQNPSRARARQAFSHEERVDAWNSLMEDIEAEVKDSPYALKHS